MVEAVQVVLESQKETQVSEPECHLWAANAPETIARWPDLSNRTGVVVVAVAVGAAGGGG